ncbi:ABC transporter substrate-binding protein [Agromyces rhizosphaerae]|nr:sugar ABC transporter substrate-binding protein [Agromyces rhizosphaerae]
MTMWSSNPDHLALFDEIADDYMADHPEVTSIEFESLTLDQLDTVLTTGITAGDAPDLTWLPVESSAEYIAAGALLDAAPVLESTEGYDYDDLVPALQERWRDGDAQYGVPFSTGALVMYYNADLYADAGVKSPADLIAEGDWTWESFREISKELTDATGVPGYVVNDFDFKNWTRLVPLFYAYGGSPWNDDATACTADSPEMQDAFELFNGMVFDDGSSPVPGQQVDFWGGQAGATSSFLSSNALLQDATYEWGIVPMPSGPAGDTQALGQAAIAALAAGDNHEAALDFLAFLTNAENAARLAQFFPPARESLLTTDVLVGSSTILTPELVQPIIDATLSSGRIFPVAENNAAVADALNSSLDEFVYVPDADLGEALGNVCAAIDPLL